MLDMVCVHLGIVLEHNVVNHLGRHPIVLVWFPPLVYNVHLPFWSCLTDCMFKFGLTHKV